MNAGAHTPLPWIITSPNGNDLGANVSHSICVPFMRIADVQNTGRIDETEANAQIIVRAVNSHAALLEALKAVDAAYQQMFDVMPVAFQTVANMVEIAIARAEGGAS